MRKDGPNASQPQGLELFFAMYAVGLVLGIEQTSQALYNDVQRQWAKQFDATFIWDVGLFIAILLLIVRFFWSTGNIRRALLRRRSKAEVPYLIFHLPVLLIQGVLVLFVCFAFVDYIGGKASAFGIILWFVIATAWNAIWLKCLLGWKWYMPESFWVLNNLGFALVASLFLALNHWNYVSPSLLLSAFVATSLVSSLLDLTKTANSYLNESGH
jgi:membrane protease YdiL (CAAX protease family)